MLWGKRRLCLSGCILIFFGSAAGCGNVQKDTDHIVILEQEQEENEYQLVAVTEGDVQVVQKINCIYQQSDEEELSFEINGKKIEKVYVEEGDRSKKGEVLAEVSLGEIDLELSEIQYQFDRNTILLRQTQEDMKLAVDRIVTTGTSMIEEEKRAYAKNLATVQQTYEYQIEDYQDKVTVLSTKLSELQEQKKQQYLYAEMNGTVSYVKDNLEGTSSVAGEHIITVMDDSECTFCSEQTEYADFFTKDQTVEMKISGISGSYSVIPYQMDNWNEKMQFTFCDESDKQNFDVGTSGEISLILEEHKNVLTLPVDAVHNADGKNYVYVLGENNIWETKWITVGLEGKDNVEITDGLSEGDMVILK